LTLATGGFCFALVRMFNGHAPGYSNCHSGLVRFDVELLQQLSALYPHSATVAVSPSALIVKSSSSACSAAWSCASKGWYCSWPSRRSRLLIA
jgi:hypothetical protein